MNTFIYIVTKRKNDINGNPRNLLRVYKFEPIDGALDCIVGKTDIGYRSNEQSVIDELKRLEWLPDGCEYNTWALRNDGIANIREVIPCK